MHFVLKKWQLCLAVIAITFCTISIFTFPRASIGNDILIGFSIALNVGFVFMDWLISIGRKEPL